MQWDNVPNGNIPFISAGLGTNFSDARGLIPGAMSNLNVLNPFNIMQAFMTGPNPDCEAITMETIDADNNKSTESNFVTLIDIQNMDPCTFSNKKNPITGQKCKESFTNLTEPCYTCYKIPNEPISKVYFGSLGILGIYILYRIIYRYILYII